MKANDFRSFCFNRKGQETFHHLGTDGSFVTYIYQQAGARAHTYKHTISNFFLMLGLCLRGRHYYFLSYKYGTTKQIKIMKTKIQ